MTGSTLVLSPGVQLPHPAIRPLLTSAAVATALLSAAGTVGSTAPAAARGPAAGATPPVPATAHLTAKAGATAPTAAAPAARASRSRRSPAWVRPVAGPVTSRYGRRWGGFHPGIDIGAHYGALVHAITGGRIVSAGWIAGYGKTVRVRAGGLVFYYPHLSQILRRHGVVGTGSVLGRVGSTGFSTGPHLHVEIRRHGRPVNPGPILWRHGVRL